MPPSKIEAPKPAETNETAVAPVHIPKLTKEERQKLPDDVIDAADTLTEDVVNNQTAG